MKARVTFVLFAAALFVAGTAMAATPGADLAPLVEEAPLMTGVEAPTAVDGVAPQEPLFLLPTIQKCNHPEPSENFCDRFNTSYCTYAWDCECCCVAIWTASGAACGNICI